MASTRRSFLRGCLGAAAAVLAGSVGAVAPAVAAPVKAIPVALEYAKMNLAGAEMTIINILSEQIALEIDRKIMNELLETANARVAIRECDALSMH